MVITFGTIRLELIVSTGRDTQQHSRKNTNPDRTLDDPVQQAAGQSPQGPTSPTHHWPPGRSRYRGTCWPALGYPCLCWLLARARSSVGVFSSLAG
ncbi:hypothetical protein JOD27_007468 [Lentzea nigeriaca]|nr:hypothetical protein [Lentzea nigeriaca]